MPDEKEPLYRVIFQQEDDIYEVYAKYITEETLVGFIEIEEVVFNPEQSVIVDPSEEKLKHEFKGVERSYIPMHAILRIDEVEQPGVAKIRGESASNVHTMPGVKLPRQEG